MNLEGKIQRIQASTNDFGFQYIDTAVMWLGWIGHTRELADWMYQDYELEDVVDAMIRKLRENK